MHPIIRSASIVAVLVAAALPARAQQNPLSVEGIFGRQEFGGAPLPQVHWMKDGRSYVDVRPDAQGGTDIVRVDLPTGAVTVLMSAAELTDERGNRIEVEDLTLSEDESRALLFHNTVRVWRSNTRGVYHVADFRSKRVVPIARITTPTGRPSEKTDTMEARFLGKQPTFLGKGLASGRTDPDLQMFAKFSPDGTRVAFVRGNNLYVTDLTSGTTWPLTTDGSYEIINGTTDWVYEEELGLSDAFRWSPDGRHIAYWRFDQSPVLSFPIDNQLGLYPVVEVLRYPKAGTPNSLVRVGVVDVDSPAQTRWLEVGPDTGQYIARMDWVGRDSLYVLRLPRKQNRADLLMISAATGRGRTVMSDTDPAYVDVGGDPIQWINNGRQFLWRSDAEQWRQIYLYDRSGRLIRKVTPDAADVISIAGIDEKNGWLYAQVAAPTPMQRNVYRYPLNGRGRAERVTPTNGSHAVTVGPNARYMVDYQSALGQPVSVALHQLPSGQQLRVLADNAALKAKLASTGMRTPEFFQVPMPDGTLLDALRILPPNFDPDRKYPVLMYVYGGPAAPTVTDGWGGSRYLWHQLLAQEGYVVVQVDNRGAAWRGRDFRKITQLRLGTLESQDQIDAAKWLGRQPWVDAGRIGIWGWSYGGYMTALSTMRGGDVFRAGISVAPVTDWRLYDTIYTERFMWIPQENEEGYRVSAPINYVEGLTAKFLLIHGTGDDNVHPQNSLILANQLQAAGKPFQMMLYPNRTHSISGGNTQVHLFNMMTQFVKDNL